jgi:hypothetical protein
MKWISTEENLPEFLEGKDYSANVIGWCDGKVGLFCRYYINGEGWLWAKADYVGFGLEGAECQCDDDYQVTHWMPIPQAPQG